MSGYSKYTTRICALSFSILPKSVHLLSIIIVWSAISLPSGPIPGPSAPTHTLTSIPTPSPTFTPTLISTAAIKFPAPTLFAQWIQENSVKFHWTKIQGAYQYELLAWWEGRDTWYRLILQPHSCLPKTEGAKGGAEVTALKPFIQFRGCSKCAFAPSFSPEKL